MRVARPAPRLRGFAHHMAETLPRLPLLESPSIDAVTTTPQASVSTCGSTRATPTSTTAVAKSAFDDLLTADSKMRFLIQEIRRLRLRRL